LNCALRALKSSLLSVAPSNAATVVAPIFTSATVPAGAASFEYGTRRPASALLATSHELVNSAPPTGSNWKLHSRGSATTTTGLFACAAAICGFA
jgi:hypothetical protein